MKWVMMAKKVFLHLESKIGTVRSGQIDQKCPQKLKKKLSDRGSKRVAPWGFSSPFKEDKCSALHGFCAVGKKLLCYVTIDASGDGSKG